MISYHNRIERFILSVGDYIELFLLLSLNDIYKLIDIGEYLWKLK